MVDEWNVWSTGGWILTRVNWSTWRKTCPSAILSTTNLLRTSLGLNSGLHSEWLVTAEALLPRNGNVHVNNLGWLTTGSINEWSNTSHILSAAMSSNSSSACLMYQQKSIMYTYNNKHLNLDAVDIYLHLYRTGSDSACTCITWLQIFWVQASVISCVITWLQILWVQASVISCVITHKPKTMCSKVWVLPQNSGIEAGLVHN